MSIDASTVKQAAAGRWPEILSSLGGIDAELLDGKNHPCPRCGGTDRFRFIDPEAGAVFCNQCFREQNGDGLAALCFAKGWSFPEAVKQLAGYLGLSNGNGRALGWNDEIGRAKERQKQGGKKGGQSKGKEKLPYPSSEQQARDEAGKAFAKPRIAKSYDYRDATGELVFQVCRMEPKSFRQRRPKPSGGWTWSVKGCPVVPYRLPEFMAQPERPVVVCEGEKDCDALAAVGLLATTNAGGASKWTQEHAQHLAGRRVVIIGDNDEPGREHAQSVAQSLHGIASSVRVVELPGLDDKGDVSDWLALGNGKAELRALVQQTPDWQPEAQPWPELHPFGAAELPRFPVDALPDDLRAWVAAESEATQTPAALPGLLSLAACSAAIARRVEVEARPGWTEPVNLYVLALLNPGERKSAVFRDCTEPLREIETELIETERPAVARAQTDRRQLEARLKRAEKLAVEKGDLEARHEAGELAVELATTPEAVLPRLIADDSTSEKLAAMLAQQGGRLASMSPEGGPFDVMAGKYAKNGAADFVVYLKGHAGDAIITDRLSRESVRVERPALTCSYAVQPAVVRGLADSPEFRGRGLLARFLFALPPSPVGRRQIAPRPVAESIRGGYHAAVRRLFWSLQNIQNTSDQFANDFPGDCQNIQNGSEPFILRLTPDAAQLLIQWETEIESELDDGGSMEAMRDWGSKLAGLTLRLAAVLHCTQHGPAGSIDADTLADAITIGRWAIPHAEGVLNLMSAGELGTDADARYLLRWIQRHDRESFTKSEAQQHGKRRFPKAEDIDPALAELTKRGFIRQRPVEHPKPGRPASPTFDVNPAAREIWNPEKRSGYSINPAPPENETPEKRSRYSGNPANEAGGASLQNKQNTFPASENANTERETFEL